MVSVEPSQSQSAILAQEHLILQAAHLSCAAYLHDPREAVGLSAIRTFESGNAKGFAGVDHQHNRAWLAFAGTNDHKDWRDDTAYTHIALNKGSARGNVHQGFKRHYDRLQSIFEPIVHALPGLDWSSAEVCCTGHSLGSAVASLASLRYADDGYLVIGWFIVSNFVGSRRTPYDWAAGAVVVKSTYTLTGRGV